MQASDFQTLKSKVSGSDSKIWKIQIIPKQVLKILKIRRELWKRIPNCGIQFAVSKAFREPTRFVRMSRSTLMDHTVCLI